MLYQVSSRSVRDGHEGSTWFKSRPEAVKHANHIAKGRPVTWAEGMLGGACAVTNMLGEYVLIEYIEFPKSHEAMVTLLRLVATHPYPEDTDDD